VDLTQQPRMMMEKIDLIPELISDLEIFKDFKEAMVYIQANKNNLM
jgi:SulP family sulfate permease